MLLRLHEFSHLLGHHLFLQGGQQLLAFSQRQAKCFRPWVAAL
jgi:hypothetical protein